MNFLSAVNEASLHTILWSGLVALTLALTFLLYTRWGQYQLIRKCLILSVLAHLLFAVYSSTVTVVVVLTEGELPETPVRVGRVVRTESVDAPDRTPVEKPAPVWDRSETRAAIASPRMIDEPPEEKINDPDRVATPLPHMEQPLPAPTLDARPNDAPEPAPKQTEIGVADASDARFAPAETRPRRAETPAEAPAVRRTPVEPERIALDIDRAAPQLAEMTTPATSTPVRTTTRAAGTKRSVQIVEVVAPIAPDQQGANLSLRPEVTRRAEAAPALASAAPGPMRNLPASLSASSAGDLDRAAPPGSAPGEFAPILAARVTRPGAAMAAPAVVRPRTSDVLASRAYGTASASGDAPATDSKFGAPVATLPKIINPGRIPSGSRDRDTAPAVYGNRSAPNRADIATSRGGSAQSEQAVERALLWLAAHQSVDGHWDGDEFSARCPPDASCGGEGSYAGEDCAVTGLVLLCYFGAGHTWEEGSHARTVAAGMNWLLAQQGPDGDLRGNGRMYSHGIATLALAEAYGMTGDARLRAPLERAVRFIVAAQNPDTGGWRYTPRESISDMSVSGWQIMALKSASLTGIAVPNEAWQGIRRWLTRISSGKRGGLASYLERAQGDGNPTPTMTAQAMLCREYLGVGPEDPVLQESADYLMDFLPSWPRANLYYWYYGALATYQFGGTHWERWNSAMRDPLLQHQRNNGHAAGSWDPVRTVAWDSVGGRIYTTALSTLCLESYYRFLPFRETTGASTATPGSARNRSSQPPRL